MADPSFLAVINGIFTPLGKIIDDLHSAPEERAAAQAEIIRLHNETLMLALQFEQKQLAASARLIAAESQGQSWLQRIWRPLTMLSFLALVVADSFGLLVFRLSAEAWTLLQIGLGG